jgi:predicted urease superfamily metal-dependent hydrolase
MDKQREDNAMKKKQLLEVRRDLVDLMAYLRNLLESVLYGGDMIRARFLAKVLTNLGIDCNAAALIEKARAYIEEACASVEMALDKANRLCEQSIGLSENDDIVI